MPVLILSVREDGEAGKGKKQHFSGSCGIIVTTYFSWIKELEPPVSPLL